MAVPQTSKMASANDFWSTYMLRDLIGSGKYGKVWRCVERSTGKEFACKELNVAGGRRQKVLTEVEVMAALDTQSGVVRLHEVYEESGFEPKMYLVMEMCNGGDAFEAIRSNGRGLDEKSSRHIFVQVVHALKHMHEAGFLHRDLKPENVFLEWDDGRPRPKPTTWHGELSKLTAKLGDFGLAEKLPETGAGMTGSVGSVPYSAPEVLTGRPYSLPADIWSLGVTLCAMLTASWPLWDESNHLLPRTQQQHWKHLSPEAEDLMRRMLAQAPEQRLTIDEVLAHPWLTGSHHLQNRLDVAKDVSTSPMKSSSRDMVTAVA